jgi:cobyrinic acid a,c-diamide synthase
VKGVVLAGTRSGVGKTVATLATIRALRDAGHAVQPAKAGPDFIDPSHHAAVAGRPSRTLDCWLQGEDGLRRNYHRGTGDVCVLEGVMGLYDGDASSTAMVAEALELPIVLVVDGSAGMESVAATAHGFRRYADRIDRDVDVSGVIAQQTHGGRHERGIREALPAELAFVGRIPPDERLEIAERHLGLHMADEDPVPSSALAEAAQAIDVQQLLELTTEPAAAPGVPAPRPGDEQTTVAVARDAAFRFVYPATVEHLRSGGDVVSFSPVAGDELPTADAYYLPGGYPERHARDLTNSRTIDALADRAASGLPIVGECGGFMALAETLTDADGDRFAMAGVLPAAVRMHERYQALDHVELAGRRENPLGFEGTRLRGHEFHYSSTTLGRDAHFAFDVERGDGLDGAHDGLLEHRTVGTYTHFHPESGAFDELLRG